MTICHPQLYNPHKVKTYNLGQYALKSFPSFLIPTLHDSFVSQADLDKHILFCFLKCFVYLFLVVLRIEPRRRY